MREIQFDKGKAVKFEIGTFFQNLAIWGIIVWVINIVLNFIWFPSYRENFNMGVVFGSYTLWLIYLYVGWGIFSLIHNIGILQSLKYYISEEKLVATHKFIKRHTDTARLQVVNSVDITQTLIGRLLNLYSVEVTYGFAQEGYNFDYDYIDEKTAEEIVDIIKPGGTRIDLT